VRGRRGGRGEGRGGEERTGQDRTGQDRRREERDVEEERGRDLGRTGGFKHGAPAWQARG